ncbi:adenylate/guanylate cyclase domain-containing protein [Thermodesulfobacteriota bacterium]
MQCPECRGEIPDSSKFCNECGVQLAGLKGKSSISIPGERKHATVMFSDLSGYTSMSEKLDPEEVKALMGRIFAEAGKIVEKYEGTVERFFGDEIMALFGVPTAHEDDPVRAVRAALEIHAAVASTSPDFEKRLGYPLSMHTGINTGFTTADKTG